MKSAFLLLALTAAAFSSCTTAYKTGQTPDDVYYSPGRVENEYVRAETRDDRNYYEGSEDYYTNRYLRMRVQNRYQWSALDDYYNNPYLYSPYAYYNNWSSPWNNHWAWNSYCNPYYGGVVIIKNPTRYNLPPSRAIVFNPNSYINSNPQGSAGLKGTNSPYRSNGYSNGANGGSSRYNNSNGSRSNSNNSYSPSNSNSNSGRSSSSSSSSSTPTRSYTPPSSSSSSSSSTSTPSSSSGSSSRPPR